MQNLVEALRNQNLLLFVGAGVSKNLGLPTWGGLIDQMANDLGYDRDVFESLGDYLTLAEYYQSVKSSIGPLRSWMDRTFHDSAIKIEVSTIHRLIVEMSCPLVYTTNYDSWLEQAFRLYNRPYTKIVNVGDFAGIREGITQIVKFHGDFEDDSSIVLTETSYFNRLGFESPLDIKLRADLLGRSILFIGYSLTDINIRYLLYKLNQLWECYPDPEVKPKSYIFLNRPNPVQEEVLLKRGIIPIVSESDDPGDGLEWLLKELIYKAYGKQ